MFTVRGLDGKAMLFEAADVLRVRLCNVPRSRDPSLVVAIDVIGAEAAVHTRERFDDIVGRLEREVAMIEFTDADGGPVVVNAARVSDIQPNGRQEAGDARTILIIGGLRQAIQEPQVTANTLIRYSKG